LFPSIPCFALSEGYSWRFWWFAALDRWKWSNLVLFFYNSSYEATIVRQNT
jgi:hypothetical protein